MISRLIFGLFFATLLLNTGCRDNSISPNAKNEKIRRLVTAYDTDEQQAQKILSLKNIPAPTDFIYIRDPRPEPDICYSYLWKTSGPNDLVIGGPSHTSVNCEHVQNLLINPAPTPLAHDANASCEQQLKQMRDQQVPPVPAIPELLQQ